jgi:DNA polymerase III epsilon subunit-like protein
VLWHESAFRVNGVSEEKIQSYPAVEYVIPKIAAFLHNYSAIEKMVFAGYCCDFDYRHVDTLFSRCGYSMSDYFNGRLIDVFELVKKASGMGLLPAVPDKKLSTMAKALGIELAHAHTALADITATRLLYEKLYKIWREQR